MEEVTEEVVVVQNGVVEDTELDAGRNMGPRGKKVQINEEDRDGASSEVDVTDPEESQVQKFELR